MTQHWHCKPYNELSLDELYGCLQIRSEVFVVGQTCVYQDMDDRDQQAWHLFGMIDDKIIAYARLLPPGIAYPDAISMGRVLTHPDFRGQGLGKSLTAKALEFLAETFPKAHLKISAQAYLQKFYEGFGFVAQGDLYDEDGIPHILMVK
ncbi:MAG: GNAT family N-acetyltransferase [Legionellales bacterium]|nr:GNAT family N-acetyltransferase [Legionellales bacterium]|tara:strand:+ start:9536 stop:9982 length:447 start_codon:yes stop_codon:yes gene_type:complete